MYLYITFAWRVPQLWEPVQLGLIWHWQQKFVLQRKKDWTVCKSSKLLYQVWPNLQTLNSHYPVSCPFWGYYLKVWLGRFISGQKYGIGRGFTIHVKKREMLMSDIIIHSKRSDIINSDIDVICYRVSLLDVQ